MHHEPGIKFPKSPPRCSTPTDACYSPLPQPCHKASSMPRRREPQGKHIGVKAIVQEAQVSYGLTYNRAKSTEAGLIS